MNYYVSWKENNRYCSKIFRLWVDALALYEELYTKQTIEQLKIKDIEYDVDFVNYQWERTDNLLGWAGGRA